MCGRYVIYETEKLVKRFQTNQLAFNVQDSYNVAPGQFMPVIVESELGRTIEVMKWGLVPQWAKDIKLGYKMINARAESIFEKPSWRGPIKYHRCLVPAHGFYEWQATSGIHKQPYYITPTDQEVFAFAGLYDIWHDSHGNELWSFTICTTDANKEMSTIHERMPVILHGDEEAQWIDPKRQSRESIEPLLHAYPDDHLAIVPVSTDVNSVKHNDRHLIYPLS
jgi:putative SOS response-associated peptidase YedK